MTSPMRFLLAAATLFLFLAGGPALGQEAGILPADPVPAPEAAPVLPPGSGTDPQPLPASAPPEADPSLAERVLEVARSFLGTPYMRGGSLPSGFDCSGLVQYVYRQIGVNLPRTSREQYGSVSPVDPRDLQPGDLLFFRIARDRISHVGIYADQGRFIHAPSRGRKVSYDQLGDPYWQKRLAGAGRLLSSESP